MIKSLHRSTLQPMVNVWLLEVSLGTFARIPTNELMYVDLLQWCQSALNSVDKAQEEGLAMVHMALLIPLLPGSDLCTPHPLLTLFCPIQFCPCLPCPCAGLTCFGRPHETTSFSRKGVAFQTPCLGFVLSEKKLYSTFATHVLLAQAFFRFGL